MTTNPIRDATYFTSPATEWQRRYEALRASMVERLPDKAVANRFGYTPGYLRVLRHQFRHGLLDFHEPVLGHSPEPGHFYPPEVVHSGNRV